MRQMRLLTGELSARQDEADPTDRTALQSVVDHVKEEIVRLHALEEKILTERGPDDERLLVGFPSPEKGFRVLGF